MRHPLAPAERRHGRQHVGRESPTQQVLRELPSISRVPHLFEIRGMQRIHQGMFGLAQKQRIVDGERLVQERKKQQAGHQDGRRGQAKGHTRGLAR